MKGLRLVRLSIAGPLLILGAGPLVVPSGVVVAHAQSVVLRPQIRVQFDASRFDSITAVNLRTLLTEAAQQGLPTAPLVNRALEGAARKVHGSRILQVVRAHAAALASAREALGSSATEEELDAGATALRAGLDMQDLAAVRASRPSGTVVIPLMVLADIVIRGVPSETAREAVTSISRMPLSDDALKGLQVTVAKNAIRGPTMAVDALRRYLRGTVPGSSSPPPAPATTERSPIRPPTQ